MTDADRAELLRLAKIAEDEAIPFAGQAWNAARKPDDSDWIRLPVEIKGKLTALAVKYAGGGSVHEGDYPPEGFFEAVKQLVEPKAVAVLPEVVSGDMVVEVQSGPEFAGPRGLNHLLSEGRVLVGYDSVDLETGLPIQPESEALPEQPAPPIAE